MQTRGLPIVEGEKQSGASLGKNPTFKTGGGVAWRPGQLREKF